MADFNNPSNVGPSNSGPSNVGQGNHHKGLGKNNKLPGLFAILSRPIPRRILAFLGIAVLTAMGWNRLWYSVKEEVLSREAYRVFFNEVRVTDQPSWIKSDVKGEVIREAGLEEPLNLLEKDLLARVAQAFALHPWVARVEKVSKIHPASLQVDLEYRKPVLMVASEDGLYAVDAYGVLLPSDDFSSQEAMQYPRLNGLESVPTPLVGMTWTDERVLQAVKIALVMSDDWGALQLDGIEAHPLPSRDGEHALIEYSLTTVQGRNIPWGEMSVRDSQRKGELPRKREWLKERHKKYGSLDAAPDGELDLRVIPETESSHTARRLHGRRQGLFGGFQR